MGWRGCLLFALLLLVTRTVLGAPRPNFIWKQSVAHARALQDAPGHFVHAEGRRLEEHRDGSRPASAWGHVAVGGELELDPAIAATWLHLPRVLLRVATDVALLRLRALVVRPDFIHKRHTQQEFPQVLGADARRVQLDEATDAEFRSSCVEGAQLRLSVVVVARSLIVVVLELLLSLAS